MLKNERDDESPTFGKHYRQFTDNTVDVLCKQSIICAVTSI